MTDRIEEDAGWQMPGNAERRMMKPGIKDQFTVVVRRSSSAVCRRFRDPSSGVCLFGTVVPPSLKLRWAGRRPSSVVCLQSGFSLVEVTLALMVMAIGILSVMSLFPAGLDQNARSIADTHAAFFAEEVFGGLQARAETNWAGLAEAQLPVAASNMWSNMGTNWTYVTGTNVVMNKYEYKDDSGVNTYEDHALRYQLVVTTNGLLKEATLFVWPGEFGSTKDPAVFYAEFFRFKP